MAMKHILLAALLYLPFIGYAKTYYNTTVESVDGHNVMTVVVNGEKKLLNFGYLQTPIVGEVFHDHVQEYLKTNVVGRIFKITELGYGTNAMVKPVLIRNGQGTLINLELVRMGLAIPNAMTMPPEPIKQAANSAESKSLGLWSKIEQFKRQRAYKESSLSMVRVKKQIDVSADALDKKRSELKIVIGDKTRMIAYPAKCFATVKSPIIFTTKYVAKNKGYKYEEKCLL